MRVLIISFYNIDSWCRYIRDRLQVVEDVAVLSDIRGDGDISLPDRFYRHLRHSDCVAAAVAKFGRDGVDDIIARCRTLRDLNRTLAHRMIGAMALSVDSVYSEWQPTFILSPTIDRYVFDVMARVAESRGIRYLEMTTSLVPDHFLFMRRGCMIPLREPNKADFRQYQPILSNLEWAPSYVDQAYKFTAINYWKNILHFHFRGHLMNLLRWVTRDPLNVRYLEALPWRGHRAGFRDQQTLSSHDPEWLKGLKSTPEEKRVFLGLQVYPESSIDYWIRDRRLIEHDNALLTIVRVLAKAGYRIFIKDHPNQFGFRLYSQMQMLASENSTTLVPYNVPGALLISECKYTLTFTGTIGFQAAMAGKNPIVVDPYYAVDSSLFIKIPDFDAIQKLPNKMLEHLAPRDLGKTQFRLMQPLLASSVPGNYYSCIKFDPRKESDLNAIDPLIKSLNKYLPFLNTMNITGLSPGIPDPLLTQRELQSLKKITTTHPTHTKL
jgi:hypothetical protein